MLITLTRYGAECGLRFALGSGCRDLIGARPVSMETAISEIQLPTKKNNSNVSNQKHEGSLVSFSRKSGIKR